MSTPAWGVLPIAMPLLVVCARRLAMLVLPDATRSRQSAAAAVLGMGVVHLWVGALGQLGLLSRLSLLMLLAFTTAGAWWATRSQRPLPSLLPLTWAANRAALAFIVATFASCIVVARLLPIWQWDSYGYHLPFVSFVLQSGGFAGVPPDLHYISTYPHNIELGMIWLRAMLPDDRLLDLAQIPYGAAAALLIASMARELGATRSLSLLAAAAWLAVPAVFLQLPTNYVDVGTAAALLGAVYFLLLMPVSGRTLALGGLALGLFLGSKPSAPIAVAFLALVTVVRASRHRAFRALGVSALLTLVFGGEMYLEMLARHGNPIWPVAVKLGPFTLPGDHSVDELLAAGAAVPHATGPLVRRLLVSWLAIDSSPVFDMKLGGLGAVFLLALPLATLALAKRRQVLLLAALVATVLSPDPSIARYVLAFPALVFALAATQLNRCSWASAVALALMSWQVVHTWPGLVGDGPSLQSFAMLDDDARRIALGPNGRPTDYPRAWSHVAPGESAAFDPDFEFPGLIWAPDLRYPVYAAPQATSVAELKSWLDAKNVRLFAVGPKNRAVLDQLPERWAPLFECRSGPCAVYGREPVTSPPEPENRWSTLAPEGTKRR